MPVTIGGGLSFCGRELRRQELDLVRQITREFSSLALTELAHTVCELLEWRRPNGSLKGRECYLFLQALHHRGWLPWLPSPQARTYRPWATVLDFQSEAQSPLTGALGDYLPLRLQRLRSPRNSRWPRIPSAPSLHELDLPTPSTRSPERNGQSPETRDEVARLPMFLITDRRYLISHRKHLLR
jgi:hypothetical protein